MLQNSQTKSQIGVIGLAVMGANLARNLASKGFITSIFNRTFAKTQDLLDLQKTEKTENSENLENVGEMVGFQTLEDFVLSLEPPRKIILMVKSGDVVDEFLDKLKPLLNPEDIVLDCGNSNWKDTQRRQKDLEINKEIEKNLEIQNLENQEKLENGKVKIGKEIQAKNSLLEAKINEISPTSQNKTIHLIGLFNLENMENWAKIITKSEKFDKIVLHLITGSLEKDKKNDNKNDKKLVETWQSFVQKYKEILKLTENKIFLGSIVGHNYLQNYETEKQETLNLAHYFHTLLDYKFIDKFDSGDNQALCNYFYDKYRKNYLINLKKYLTELDEKWLYRTPNHPVNTEDPNFFCYSESEHHFFGKIDRIEREKLGNLQTDIAWIIESHETKWQEKNVDKDNLLPSYFCYIPLNGKLPKNQINKNDTICLIKCEKLEKFTEILEDLNTEFELDLEILSFESKFEKKLENGNLGNENLELQSKKETQQKPKILFATTNNHKIRLFKASWENANLNQKFELLTLNDLPKKETQKIEENSGSFTGDSLIKAKIYAKAYNLPTISQDRGFVFDALNWPGTDSKKVMFGDNEKIYNSKNWEIEKADNLERAKKVLARIEGKDRNMRIIQGLAVVLPNGEFETEEKITKGLASEKVADKIGGAFDWFFVPNGLNHTLSEFATKEEKEEYEATNLYPITSGIISFLEKNLVQNEDLEIQTLKEKLENPKQHFHLISCGVSGGEEGALHGPSIMPSGEPGIVNSLLPILEKIAAKDFVGRPCVTNIGLGPSGHFVKMVHNGIEYALMQGIAEIYGILRWNQYSNEEMVSFFSYFQGDNSVDGYLLEITRKILETEDKLEIKKESENSQILQKENENTESKKDKTIHLIGLFNLETLENWAKIIQKASFKFDKIILHLITGNSENNKENGNKNETKLVETWQEFEKLLDAKSKNEKSELLENMEKLENRIILGSLSGASFATSLEIDKIKESLEVMFQIRNLVYEPFYKKLFRVSQFFSKDLVIQEGKDLSNYEYSQVKKFYIPHFGQKSEFDNLINELFYQNNTAKISAVVKINDKEDISESDLRPIAFDSVGMREYDDEFGIKPNDTIYIFDLQEEILENEVLENTNQKSKLGKFTEILAGINTEFELDLEILTTFETEIENIKTVRIKEFENYLKWTQKPKPKKVSYLLDKISPKAASKGTGIWTVQTALELGVAVPTLAEALFVRSFSNNRPKIAREIDGGDIDCDWGARFGSGDKVFLQMALESVFAASFIQGIALIQEANEQFGWQIDIQEVCRIWQGGCIIRTKMLPRIAEMFAKDGKVSTNSFVTFNPYQSFGNLTTYVSCPVIWSAINYMYAFWSKDLPTNLIQAQRDFFGAHTYERIDKHGTFSGGWNKI